MILYLIIIAIAVLAIAAVVSLVTASGFFTVLGWTALATAVVMVIDGLTATLCQVRKVKWNVVAYIPFKIIPIAPFHSILPCSID